MFKKCSITMLNMSNKTISINPELFQITNQKRRSKKKDNTNKNDIKIKSVQTDKQKKKIMRKQHILKMLREQQEKNYQKILQQNNTNVSHKQNEKSNSNFKDSVQYLQSLSANKPKHNYTSKVQETQVNRPYSKINELEPIIMDNNFDDSQNPVQLSQPRIENVAPPRWGCLKNGSLPTYRDWKRNTQKVYDNSPLMEINENQNEKKNEIISFMKAKREIVQPKLKTMKQRKTIRRNYKVGKSKVYSKVSVLVSNKTIRNNIMNQTQQYKTIPIEDVRKYLVKRGFIRVGSSAPNDVLRKMYETSNLICGEVENHNTDNLLYNYLNDN